MAANPNGTPFSAQELASFATVETPIEDTPVHKGLSELETQALIQQSVADSRRETDFLRGQLAAQQTMLSQPVAPIVDNTPKHIPVVFNDKGEAVVDMSSLTNAMDKQLTSYHDENIAPFAPAVRSIQEQNAITQAVASIKQLAPDLLEGRDPNVVGKMAIDFYNSGFNTGGDNQANRTAYAVEQMRGIWTGGGSPTGGLPVSTGGNFLNNVVPAYNQTGRTEAGNGGAHNPYGYAKGAKIELAPKSINDLGGINEMQAYAQWQEGMRQYNIQNQMGWIISEKGA